MPLHLKMASPTKPIQALRQLFSFFTYLFAMSAECSPSPNLSIKLTRQADLSAGILEL